MSEMVYAVHTRTCTYLLDEDGVCGWVLSPSGDRAQDRCIGAQFVACLDLREQGGLVGELRIGAAGLFARSEGGRLVLLKTSTIEHVEYRRSNDISVTAALPDMVEPAAAPRAPPAVRPDEPPSTERLPRGAARQQHPMYDEATADHAGHGAERWTRTEPPPYVHAGHAYEPNTGPLPEGFNAAAQQMDPEPLDVMDLEELSTFSAEVTLTIPLYRPDPDDPPPRWAGSYDAWQAQAGVSVDPGYAANAEPGYQGVADADPGYPGAANTDPVWRWPPEDR